MRKPTSSKCSARALRRSPLKAQSPDHPPDKNRHPPVTRATFRLKDRLDIAGTVPKHRLAAIILNQQDHEPSRTGSRRSEWDQRITASAQPACRQADKLDPVRAAKRSMCHTLTPRTPQLRHGQPTPAEPAWPMASNLAAGTPGSSLHGSCQAPDFWFTVKRIVPAMLSFCPPLLKDAFFAGSMRLAFSRISLHFSFLSGFSARRRLFHASCKERPLR